MKRRKRKVVRKEDILGILDEYYELKDEMREVSREADKLSKKIKWYMKNEGVSILVSGENIGKLYYIEKDYFDSKRFRERYDELYDDFCSKRNYDMLRVKRCSEVVLRYNRILKKMDKKEIYRIENEIDKLVRGNVGL